MNVHNLHANEDNWKCLQQSEIRSVIRSFQDGSTPGCCKLIKNTHVSDIIVVVEGIPLGVSDVQIWVATKDCKTLSFLEGTKFEAKKVTEKAYYFENVTFEPELYVGLCFTDAKKGDSFEFLYFDVIKVPSKKIDVLFVSIWDHANSAWDFCKSLRTIGLRTHMVKGHPHPFQYGDEAPLLKEIANGVKEDTSSRVLYAPYRLKIEKESILADLINHSQFVVWHTCVYPDSDAVSGESLRNSAALAVGRNYRQNPSRCGLFFKNTAGIITVTPDFYNADDDKNHFTQWPVNLKYFSPSYNFVHPTKIIVGHSPSNPMGKGTEVIVNAVLELEKDIELADKFQYIGTQSLANRLVPWPENIKKYQLCDVYVESLQLEVDGFKCGTWGLSCFEAAASGCLVITNQLYADIYSKEYGECPVYIANTGPEITKQLRKILKMTRPEIIEEKKKFRVWIEKFHSYEATAKRLWSRLLREHFPDDIRHQVDEAAEYDGSDSEWEDVTDDETDEHKE